MPEAEFLNVPPLEAIRLFRAKGYRPGFDWRDTDALLHLRYFTVAKAMDLDVLEDIRAAVDRSIADGITLETFSKELEPLLQRRGWWGRRRMTDPLTGESRIVQLGSPRRLRTIYDTNLRMAYARGRWERIERVARTAPWLRYVAVLDGKTRPEHLAWHGTVLPWDHPFWATHYPPNGWYCRCGVVQLSEAELEEFGYAPTAPPADADAVRPWTNRRTGETLEVPVGIDPGFGHNVGTIDPAREARRRLEEKLGRADPAISAAAQAAIAAALDELARDPRIREELERQGGAFAMTA